MRRYETSVRQLDSVLSMLSRILDIRVTFFDLDGHELDCFDIKAMSPYCTSRRRSARFHARCRACDQQHLTEARETRDVVIYHCHASLIEGIVPLYDRRGVYLGAIVFGQLRDRLLPAPKDGTARQQRLYAALQACTEARARDIGYLLKYVSEYIIESELIRYQNRPWVDRLETYIEQHLGEKLTTGTLAGVVQRSASFIAHNFRAEFGESPKGYILKRRMEEARTMLENGASVQDTATRLGFYDAFHFSKQFKRHWGAPPSRYKAG